MDIYIVRKCKVELKEFHGSMGSVYKLPVMTREDVHSYVFRERLNAQQKEKIQLNLENLYGKPR